MVLIKRSKLKVQDSELWLPQLSNEYILNVVPRIILRINIK